MNTMAILAELASNPCLSAVFFVSLKENKNIGATATRKKEGGKNLIATDDL
jgi:hypothetical protein